MKTTDMFEHGSPIIKCVPGSLEIDARNAPHGSVTLSNAGSGELIGSITSKSPRLTPSEHSFKGVRFIAEFHADTTAFKEGETENTTVVVTSNGGEIIIPVTVTASAPAVSVKDGRQISSLREFADYAQSEPNLARQLFVKSDFNVWLLKLNYEYMTIYEHFAADPIKERGLDGFLIFNNLKTRSLLVPPTENRIKIEIPPRSKGITQVALQIQREGFGYITATVESDSSWLNIFKTKISSHDFNEDGICNVDIFADSAKFSARRAESKITVTQESGKSFLYSVTAHK
ncbi:MAG: DUF5717 family protein, partial [Clostridiales bacterium]|nr:DUF5717 family protein [Clostridiales bacterium]